MAMNTQMSASEPFALSLPQREEAFTVTSFTGHEAVGELYSILVHAVTDEGDETLSTALLQQPASLLFQSDGTTVRTIHGIVARVQSHGVMLGGRCAYSLTIVPSFWKLKRRAHGPRKPNQVAESAVVVGPENQEIYTDEFGRVKVQFPWDLEGTNDDRSSCWLRVVQAWAGAGWGAQFIPRVGMEVIVTFPGGDLDRPIITGCVYNATHPPPFKLPDEKTRSGFRTSSTPDNAGANSSRSTMPRGASSFSFTQLATTTKLSRTIGHHGRAAARNPTWPSAPVTTSAGMPHARLQAPAPPRSAKRIDCASAVARRRSSAATMRSRSRVTRRRRS